jgi:Protein of unknown function (DUF2721)
MLDNINPSSAENVAHVIQVALAPVFLLSGIATLLAVFSNRLARVADRLFQLTRDNESSVMNSSRFGLELTRLHCRSVALDWAVGLGALAAFFTVVSVLTLLVGTLGNAKIDTFLFWMFGLAAICILGAIASFVFEMMMTTRGVRTELAVNRGTER